MSLIRDGERKTSEGYPASEARQLAAGGRRADRLVTGQSPHGSFTDLLMLSRASQLYERTRQESKEGE